jgi:hypothetical protein
MIIQKKYKYTGKYIKISDKLLNACKSNAKYTFEFKNKLYTIYLCQIKMEYLFEKNQKEDPKRMKRKMVSLSIKLSKF